MSLHRLVAFLFGLRATRLPQATGDEPPSLSTVICTPQPYIYHIQVTPLLSVHSNIPPPPPTLLCLALTTGDWTGYALVTNLFNDKDELVAVKAASIILGQGGVSSSPPCHSSQDYLIYYFRIMFNTATTLLSTTAVFITMIALTPRCLPSFPSFFFIMLAKSSWASWGVLAKALEGGKGTVISKAELTKFIEQEMVKFFVSYNRRAAPRK